MEFENDQVETTGEEDLMEAIRQFKESEANGEFEDEDFEESDNDDTSDESEEESEEDNSDEEDESDSDEEVDEEPVKKVQSKEDNAKFAAQRRQQELDKRVQEELERVRQSAPEFQLAKMLADQYGVTPDVMLEKIKEQQLREQAEKAQVPVEFLREKQELKAQAQAQQEQINRLMFNQWHNQVQVESANLLKEPEFSMLSQADMDVAVDYMLKTMGRNDVPLEQVVYAVHGKKIVEGLRKNAEQEVLAKESGRSKKPLAPKTGKPSETQTLTEEEKYVARQMGISDDDYLKYK